MKTVLGIGMAALCAGLLVAGASGEASAKEKNGGGDGWLQYAVPFTCGLNGADTDRVVPGTYATAVNVLNGGASDAMFSSHVALTFPPETGPGEVSDVVLETLLPGEAFQVDCGEILGGTYVFPSGPPASPYVQGFLVLLSAGPLDVSATHTASGATGEVSMVVQQVAGRSVSGPGDDGPKVDVCHVPKGNVENAHTINVSTSAVPAHLGHGDSLGACE